MVTENERAAAKALADVIKESDAYKTVVAKQKEYNENETIATCMTEYSVQQELLTLEYSKAESERDKSVMDVIQSRIDELYQKIVNEPVYLEYKEACDEYNAYYNEINAEIDFYITGKRSSCSGDCSSCGGCH